MAAVWVSFRVVDRTIGGKSYDERLSGLVKAVEKAGTMWWDQTTSFIIVETAKSVDNLATVIKAAIVPSVDLALLREMDSRSARIIGNNDDDDIFKLMPYLKKA